MRRLACAAALATALPMVGCGGSDSGTDQMVRTGAPDPQADADGRLASNPAPLTVEKLEEMQRGTAEKAVMTLLFWAQWGNYPSVVDGYDADVVDSLVTAITGAYAWLRPSLLVSQPRLVSVRPAGDNTFVGVELRSTNGAPTRESFLMHRVAGDWRLRYDTLLDRGIFGAAIQRLTPDPNAKTQPARVLREAEAEAQRYRDTYPSLALQEADARESS
jgi:hypothetical protein